MGDVVRFLRITQSGSPCLCHIDGRSFQPESTPYWREKPPTVLAVGTANPVSVVTRKWRPLTAGLASCYYGEGIRSAITLLGARHWAMQQPLGLMTGKLDPDSYANSLHPVSHKVKRAQCPVSLLGFS